jgi:hypothetical protein
MVLLLVFAYKLDDPLWKLVPDSAHRNRATSFGVWPEIDAHLVHGINSLLIKRGCIRSSADGVEAIARQAAKERLGHLRPARIAGPEKEHARLDHK